MTFSERRSSGNAPRFAAAPGEQSGKGPRPLRVLVVDDDRDTVLSLMMLLREEGHEVHSVYTARRAMDAVIDFDPDVVVLDIHLPENSGWEVAWTIRDWRGKERPMLIGISGLYREGADRVLSQILGFNHYLMKPYAPADLLALIASVRNAAH
jgi:DNA-binding response OmpR family regulator